MTVNSAAKIIFSRLFCKKHSSQLSFQLSVVDFVGKFSNFVSDGACATSIM